MAYNPKTITRIDPRKQPAGGIFGENPDAVAAPLERAGIFRYKTAPDIMPEKLTTTIPGLWVRNQALGDDAPAQTVTIEQPQNSFPWSALLLSLGASFVGTALAKWFMERK